MKKSILIGLATALVTGSPATAALIESSSSPREVEALTLEQAYELAERLQPELAEAKAAVAMAEGRARQSGSFPNPEAILSARQIPFSSSAPNEREYEAGIGQTVPLGPRLSKAREAGLFDREARVRRLEVKQREVRKRVHTAFATALYQDKAFNTQNSVLKNAERAVLATKARVEAGDAIREELARSEMELARTKVEMRRAEALHKQALVELASAVGDVDLSVKSLEGNLDATFEIPTLEVLATNLSNQPEILQANAEVRAQSVRLDLAKVERIPDVKVEVLYHRLEATRSDTLDIGLSIPLPLFNRNQGRIREAHAEQAAAEARARMARNEVQTRLKDAYLRLTSALANRRIFQSDILGRAETILKSAEARYAAGDVSLNEVLPVRRDWAAVQLSYLESLRDVMQAWGELKALTPSDR